LSSSAFFSFSFNLSLRVLGLGFLGFAAPAANGSPDITRIDIRITAIILLLCLIVSSSQLVQYQAIDA